MSGHTVYAIGAVATVAVATMAVRALGLRRARTTSDFYVASRAVTPGWNAAAIGGEYLSAASFLGIAGLVLAYGFDVLWYPVGYTAGYLVLLALVAAPLRRSGAYTLPDFAEIRLGSALVRRMASVLVVLIGWLYLVPQLQGASLTLQTQTGAPRWVGGLVVCAVVLTAVGVGGMRSITFAQAFQFWLKFTALLVPAIVVLIALAAPRRLGRHRLPDGAARHNGERRRRRPRSGAGRGDASGSRAGWTATPSMARWRSAPESTASARATG